MKIKAVIYPAFVIFIGLPIGVLHTLNFGFEDRLVEFLILLAFVVAIETFEISLFGNWFVSVSSSVYLASVYVGGSELGVSLAVLAMAISEPFNRRKYFLNKRHTEGVIKSLFQVSQLSLSVGVAAAVYGLLSAVFPPTSATDWLGIVAAFLSYTVTNNALVALAVYFENGASFVRIIKEYSSNALFGILPIGAMSVVIAFLFNLDAAALILMMLVLTYYMVVFLRDTVRRRKSISQLELFLNPMNLSEASRRELKALQDCCVGLAKELGLDKKSLETVREASKFRSIGVFGLSEDDIKKCKDEHETLSALHEKSASILDKTEYKHLSDTILCLREWFDGSGPKGLKGEEIHIESRIILACIYWAVHDNLEPYSGNILDPYLVDLIKRSPRSKRI